MKIENVQVCGFRPALRGMRNPMNSWGRSDTTFGQGQYVTDLERTAMGPNDLALARNLIKAGTEHRKFLRQIMIWADIEVPRCIWTELDTYKVGTVRNSCSTMHKLGSRPLTQDDFEDGLVSPSTLDSLNSWGLLFRKEREPTPLEKTVFSTSNDLLYAMKMALPESFLQRATYSMSYETALSMYFQRRAHRMPQWSCTICPWIATLPYMQFFIDAAEKT